MEALLRLYHSKLKRGRGTLKRPVFGFFEKNGHTEIVPEFKRLIYKL